MRISPSYLFVPSFQHFSNSTPLIKISRRTDLQNYSNSNFLMFSSSPALYNLNSTTGLQAPTKPRTRHTVTCIASTTTPTDASSTLYDVLGIKAGSTCHEIRAAYRHLARECHPDTVGDAHRAESSDEFMRVHTAYTTLSDPDKRANYDRNMMAAVGGRRRWAPSQRPCRTWETDQCW